MSEELLPEIQAVTLPERNETEFPVDGARCIMVGWGCTARGRREKIPLSIPLFPVAEPNNEFLRGSVQCLITITCLHCFNNSWMCI